MSMITLKEILLAINRQLVNVLPNVSIQSNDIAKGFTRPSLFVDFDNVTVASYIGNKRERTVDVIVYYFPTSLDENQIELFETQDILEEAFRQELLIKESFFVFPMEVSSVISDGVLQTSFSIYLLETLPEEAGDAMSEIIINIDNN